MSVSINITSPYGVVSVDDRSIEGYIFLGFKDSDWQEWRIIDQLTNNKMGYKRIKIEIKAQAEFWFDKKDSSVLCSDVRIKELQGAVLNDERRREKWVERKLEKSEMQTVRALVDKTLSHFIYRSSNSIAEGCLGLGEPKEAVMQTA